MQQFNALAEGDHERRMELVAEIADTVRKIVETKREYKMIRVAKTAGLVAAAAVFIPVVATAAVVAMLAAPVVFTPDRR
jgi:hypothetical protein